MFSYGFYIGLVFLFLPSLFVDFFVQSEFTKNGLKFYFIFQVVILFYSSILN